jgi:hypothetical protein
MTAHLLAQRSDRVPFREEVTQGGCWWPAVAAEGDRVPSDEDNSHSAGTVKARMGGY